MKIRFFYTKSQALLKANFYIFYPLDNLAKCWNTLI